MSVLLVNNSATTLAVELTTTANALTVAAGTGAKFPSPASGDYFYLTLLSTTGEVEIVKVTARINDVMTIVRGQDNTTAKQFPVNSRVEARVNAQSVRDAVTSGMVVTMPRADAVERTIQSKLADTVSVFDFMTPAEIASVRARDGLVDVAPAIQRAINAVKPVNEAHPEKGTAIHFPEGIYRVDSTINLYSGVGLIGEGVGTVVRYGPTLTGAVFYLTQVGNTGYCANVIIRYMKIQTVPDIFTTVTNDIWAIKADQAVIVGSCIFADLLLWVRYGFKLDGYTQSTLIHTVMSVGQLDQLLNLQGNYNRIVSLAKEGGGGEGLALNLQVPNPPGSGIATNEPYVFIGGPNYGDANQNIFEHLLIEGAGSPNKCNVKLQNAGAIEFKDYWHETSIVNGYNIELDSSSLTVNVLANGPANPELTPLGYSNGGKYKLRNGSQLYIKAFSNTYGYDKWQDFFDYDNSSFVVLDSVYTQLGLDIYKIANSSNLRLKSYTAQNVLLSNTPGRVAISKPHHRSGQNLFINPSFEAGVYGWNINSGAPVTTTVEPSQVAQGSMLKCITTGLSLDQITPITAAQVGVPLTLTFVVKLEGAGWVFPVITNEGSVGECRVYAGQGWQTVTITHRPQSAGSFYSGLSMAGGGGASCTLYVDEMSICFGDEGIINSAKFGSFELNQRTFTAATAVPTTGTWKAGDRVFNAAPAVGQPKGWICTVAGSPGIWVSEGNL